MAESERERPAGAVPNGALERAPHKQGVTKEIYRGSFTHAQFVAHLHDIKFSRNGDIVATITIPFRYRNRGLPLSDAWGVPLSVDIQRWNFHDNFRRQLHTRESAHADDNE